MNSSLWSCAESEPAMSIPDWYAVLDVSPRASFQEVARAYRLRVLETHPDRGGTTEAFLQVRHAWEVLGDPASRSRYDTAQDGGSPPAGSWTEPTVSPDEESTHGVEWQEISWFPLFAGISFDDPRVAVRSVLTARLVRWIGLGVLAVWWWPGMILTRGSGDVGLSVAHVWMMTFPFVAIATTILMIIGVGLIRTTTAMAGWSVVAILLHTSERWCWQMAGWLAVWIMLAWGCRLTRRWTLWPRTRVMSANNFGDPIPGWPHIHQIVDALTASIPAARVIWQPRGALVAIAVDRTVAYLGAGHPDLMGGHARIWNPADPGDLTPLVQEIGAWLISPTGGYTIDPLTLSHIEVHRSTP